MTCMRAPPPIPTFPQCEATHAFGARCVRGAEHVGIHVGAGPVTWGSAQSGDRGQKKAKVSDPNAPAWLTYRPGKGYFWGPAHKRAGEPAVFGIYDGQRA